MKILFYVSGSISCYKSFDLTRSLINSGNEVKVILSPGAEEFIKRDLFLYLGTKECFSSDADFKYEKGVLHTTLASWCDLFVICPASANTLSYLANGMTKDLGTTTFLAIPQSTPILIFPAMNTKMLDHPMSKRNLENLKVCSNVHLFPTKEGTLACGEVGAGKLLDIDEVEELILSWPLKTTKRRIVVSTGASISKFDDVRYLTNPSSGKTGKLVAVDLLKEGHQVTVLYGPNASSLFKNLKYHPNFQGVLAYSTIDFLNEMSSLNNNWDCYISAAALGDIQFDYGAGKLKKGSFPDAIKINSAPDVLKNVLCNKLENQKVIGFAAETDLTKSILKEKFERKPVDLLIGTKVFAGDSTATSAGFSADQADYKIMNSTKDLVHEGPMNKSELSSFITHQVNQWFN